MIRRGLHSGDSIAWEDDLPLLEPGDLPSVIALDDARRDEDGLSSASLRPVGIIEEAVAPVHAPPILRQLEKLPGRRRTVKPCRRTMSSAAR